MIDIEDYMKKSLLERQEHLRPDDPCLERGGFSTYFKGMMAHIHGTTMPKGWIALVCHHCGNEKCSNPNHLYFGTQRENMDDAKRHGTFKNAWESTVEKYGHDRALEMVRENQKKACVLGGSAGKGKKRKL